MLWSNAFAFPIHLRGRFLLKTIRLLSAVFISMLMTACTTMSEPASLAPPHAPIVDGQPVEVVPHPDPLSLLESDDPQLAANKRLVWDMWRSLLNAGHVEAADMYMDENYIQHNPMADTGREAIKAYVAASRPRMDEIPEIVEGGLIAMVAEGDYVAMAFVTEYDEPDGSGDTYTSTHFDLFRIDDDLIVEHWDSVQRPDGYSPTPVSQGGPLPIIGVKGLAQLPMLHNDDLNLANNKRLVFDTWRHIPEGGREELAELYLDPIYIQHNPNASTGRDGFVEYFSQRPDSPVETYLEDPIVAIIAEGDLVVQVLQEERPDTTRPGEIYYIPWFDMFKVVNGRLYEHWDTASKGELPAAMQEAQ